MILGCTGAAVKAEVTRRGERRAEQETHISGSAHMGNRVSALPLFTSGLMCLPDRFRNVSTVAGPYPA